MTIVKKIFVKKGLNFQWKYRKTNPATKPIKNSNFNSNDKLNFDATKKLQIIMGMQITSNILRNNPNKSEIYMKRYQKRTK